VSYFVTKTHPDLGHVTAPVSLYYDDGSTPTARVSAPDPTRHVSLIITLVGELHDIQTRRASPQRLLRTPMG
jgi:hypothetical protein